MSFKLLVIPIWYSLTNIVVIILSSMIIKNKYDTNICYDGLYINETMQDLFIMHLSLYLVVTIFQIFSYIAIYIRITKEKTGIMLVANLLCFIVISMLNGLYLNFIYTSLTAALAAL